MGSVNTGKHKQQWLDILSVYMLVAVVILLAGMAVRVHRLGAVSFWGDEVTTKLRATGSLVDTVEHISRGGVHFLPYFAALHLFPSDNELLLRMPSVFMAMLGIALFIRAARDLYGSRSLGLMAGGVLAFSQYDIYLSRMARPYAQVFFFSLLASYLFLKLLAKRRSTALWIGYLLASVFALQSHYFMLALPLAQLVTLSMMYMAGTVHRRFIGQWLGVQIVAFIPLALWLLFVVQPKQGAMDWIARPTWDAPFETLAYLAAGYERFVWYIIPALIVSAVGLLAGGFFAFKRFKHDPALFYWVVLTVGPLVGIFAISMVSRHSYYMDRYFMVLLPGVLLLIIGGLHYLRGLRWDLLGMAILLVTGVILVGREFRTGENYERFAWRQAIEFVRANMAPGDYLALPYYDPAFEYYYGDIYTGPIIPLYVMADQLAGYYSFSDMDYGRTWVFYSPELHDDKVRDWIAKQETLQIFTFNGLEIIVLQAPE